MADVNTGVINQAGTLLAALYAQVTGSSTLAPVTTGDFISLANATLLLGVDPVMGAMSTLIGKTIFTNRPYAQKLKVLSVTDQEYAWHNRKMSISDKPYSDSEVYGLTDGYAVDQQIVNVPDLLQLNFYGENTWQDFYTMFEDQVEKSLKGPEELVQFLGMISQNCADKVEQAEEAFKRFALAGYIGALLYYDTNSLADGMVVHALTEYNNLTGQSLTSTTVFQGTNFKNFCDWLFARMITVSDSMTERSYNHHVNITSHAVARHTPRELQKLVMLAPFSHMMTNMAVTNTFNAQAFERIEHESVNFWQALDTPSAINVTPGVLKVADGSKENAGSAITKDYIIGVLFDRDALGTVMMEKSYRTAPYNARGHYQNIWFSEVQRSYADHTENGCVFVLD